MSIKGLEQAIANLESISKTAVPRASSQAVNRVATRAISRSTRRLRRTPGCSETRQSACAPEESHGT
jgi:hypothetical protein